MIYPWQKKQYERLTQAYQNGVMPHALLLTGLDGMGKVDFARSVAKWLLCDRKVQDGCGACSSCSWAMAGSHPDLFEVTLEEKSRVIKVDQVRHLIEKLQQTAHGEYRVALLYPADQMNPAAANALLKTLEEPAGRTLIILITSQSERLPATVRSRCQHIDFSAGQKETSENWLRSQGCDESALLLLNHAYGAPLFVLNLRDSGYLDCLDRVFDVMVSSCLQNKNLVASAATLLKQDMHFLLRAMLSIACDLLKLKLDVSDGDLVNVDRVEQMKQLLPYLETDALMRFYSKLLQTRSDLNSGAHLNVQLELESMLLSWMNIKSTGVSI